MEEILARHDKILEEAYKKMGTIHLKMTNTTDFFPHYQELVRILRDVSNKSHNTIINLPSQVAEMQYLKLKLREKEIKLKESFIAYKDLQVAFEYKQKIYNITAVVVCLIACFITYIVALMSIK